MKCSVLFILAALLNYFEAFAQPSLPQLRGVKFNIVEVSSPSPVLFSVSCSIETKQAFEIESANLYTIASGSSAPALHSTLGVGISGDVTPTQTKSVGYSFLVKAGIHDISTSVKNHTESNISGLKIETPIKPENNYWCIEILPTFRGKLICTEGPPFEKALEQAQGNVSQAEQANMKRMQELKSATGSSADLCKFVGEAIPESLQAQRQCKTQCWKSHRGMSRDFSAAASPDQICDENCRRVTPDQVTLATRAFTVCESLVPVPTTCSLATKILEVCGTHTEKGCGELGKISSEKCK